MLLVDVRRGVDDVEAYEWDGWCLALLWEEEDEAE